MAFCLFIKHACVIFVHSCLKFIQLCRWSCVENLYGYQMQLSSVKKNVPIYMIVLIKSPANSTYILLVVNQQGVCAIYGMLQPREDSESTESYIQPWARLKKFTYSMDMCGELALFMLVIQSVSR